MPKQRKLLCGRAEAIPVIFEEMILRLKAAGTPIQFNDMLLSRQALLLLLLSFQFFPRKLW